MSFTPIPEGTDPWGDQMDSILAGFDGRITSNEDSVSAIEVVNDQQWNEITINRNNIAALTDNAAPGTYVPQNWGQFWRPKRDAAEANGARVLFLGDSVTQGYFCSNTRTTSFVGRVRTQLQSLYGNGGTGMIPASNCAVIAQPSVGIIAAWEANNSLFTTTGTWLTGGLFVGPGISYLSATSAASATFKVTGTTIKMHPIGSSAPRAAWTYNIDGAGAVTVPGVVVAPSAVQTTTVTGLTDTEHTVVISWAGAAAETLWFCGLEAGNATGVQVHNLGRTGSTTTNWVDASADNALWNGGPSFPGDLAVIGLGINDAIGAITSATWLSNMGTIINRIKAANNGATDIILLNQHGGQAANLNLYGAYSAQLRGLAETYGCAIVDVWADGRNSWDYYQSLSFWGTGTAGGGPGTSTVHPGDIGHQIIANALLPLITS